MDSDSEIQKLKWILIAGVAFLVSSYFSYKELKFALWGKTAQAKITRTFETASVGRRGRDKPMLAVEYTFSEADGKSHSERDDVPPDWPLPEGDSIVVQYLPGVADSSRLEGHSNAFAVWIFLGCLGFLGFAGFKLWKEATDAVHGRSRKPRR